MRQANVAQRGIAGVILLLMVFLIGTTILISSLDGQAVKLAREQKTTESLAQAKAVLIGWSTGHASMPGALPCPDTSNSGSSGACTGTVGLIGRLPWKTLGLNDLRDGNGECLWYAISPNYRNTVTVSSRVANPLNSNIPGTIIVKGTDGIDLPAPINPVIAVIIAPGASLATQNRTTDNTICGGNTTASNYLDSTQGVNNATGNVAGNNYTFIAGSSSGSFNDRLIYITAEDLFVPVRRRIANELVGAGSPATSGLLKYYANNHVYPWAGDVSGNVVTNASSGYVPYNSSSPAFTLTPTSLRSWMINNAWLTLTTYQIGADFNPNSVYPQQCTVGCVTARNAVVPASITVGGGASNWTSRVCATNATMTSCPLP